VWPHRHKKIYNELGKIFNLNQHGWLNIQSFHLNLSYGNEVNGVLLHNLLANLCPYLTAISSSSPLYEGQFGSYVDNRLAFYKVNQREVPSVTGDVIPEYVSSFSFYKEKIIGKYSEDLAKASAPPFLLFKEWINSRGIIIRFDRAALEVRVMDEQECIKSDVALGCFVRAALRGMAKGEIQLLPHEILVNDFNAIVAEGLDAKVLNPLGSTARNICRKIYRLAWENATEEEKRYLPIVNRRIESGSLSEVIRERVERRAQRTDLKEAIVSVYSKLIKCLGNNEPYF
jgi:gamma-glutamyl:cysteine ligase YbdK (ATP-grasp superfamily)